MAENLRDAIKENRVVLGSKRAIKYLKNGKIKTIVVANNCPEEVMKDFEHYAKLSGTAIEKFDGTSKQLGVSCGKPFSIAALGITK